MTEIGTNKNVHSFDESHGWAKVRTTTTTPERCVPLSMQHRQVFAVIAWA